MRSSETQAIDARFVQAAVGSWTGIVFAKANAAPELVLPATAPLGAPNLTYAFCMLPETGNAGSRATGGRDIAAASLRDPHLEAFFPGVLVCDDRGALIDADPAARALIDRAGDPSALLESLVGPATEALAADSGAL